MFLTGGSGTLGAELIKIFNDNGVDYVSPTSQVCDIRDYDSVDKNIKMSKGYYCNTFSSSNKCLKQ